MGYIRVSTGNNLLDKSKVMAFETYLSLLNEKIKDALLPILGKDDLIGLVGEYTVEVAPAKLAQLMQAIFAAFLANKTLPYKEAGVDPSQFKLNDYSPTQIPRLWVAARNKGNWQRI